MFNKARVITGIALIFSFSVFSSVAYGIGRSWVNQDKVYVCINKANGDLHAVGEYESCKSSEELVVLPTSQGSQGATGATGATGAQGDTGARGPVGSTGAQGPVGSTGAQGPVGATGSQGVAGSAGVQGATGVTGPEGATGATGATGSQGPAGTQGDTGAVGATGAQGPKGDTGALGATGSQGATGAQGATGVAGTTGQQAVTANAANGGATVSTASMGPTPVPGLSATVLVTSTNAVLYVQADGGVTNNGGQVNDYVSVDVRVLVDGVVQTFRTVDVELGRFAFRETWSMGFSMPVTAGSHTVSVDTSLRSASAQNGQSPSATVGGSGRGSLTVLVLNR